jgi:parvulin-like peptidyl-prolyl isomerase
MRRTILSLAAFAWCAAPCLGQTETAAIVNGEVLTTQQFVDHCLLMNGYPILQSLINDTLVRQEAKRRGIDLTADEIQRGVFERTRQFPNEDHYKKFLESSHYTEEDFQREVARDLLYRKLAEPSVAVTEQDMKDCYEQGKAQRYLAPAQFQIKELCVADEAEAQGIRAQILQGASFEDLPRQKSILPSASQGGDLGWIAEHQRGTVLEKALSTLSPGQVSEVIKTPEGFYVVRLEDKKPAHVQTFEEAKQEVERDCHEIALSREIGKMIKSLRESSQIEIRLWKKE